MLDGLDESIVCPEAAFVLTYLSLCLRVKAIRLFHDRGHFFSQFFPPVTTRFDVRFCRSWWPSLIAESSSRDEPRNRPTLLHEE